MSAKFSRGHIMSVNEQSIYDAALARWGHDRQMLKIIDACSQLAGALSRFLTHEQNVGQVCAAAVEVDIMIEQLRSGGMGAIMEDEKIRKLHRLARRLLPQDSPQTTDATFAPDNLINEALDAGEQALALYNRGRSTAADKRLAARFIRKAVGHFWHVAQHCISEAQREATPSREVSA
ncbi:hypothetical protein SG0318 [Sodalis glossinidius str. 'morsitans']|uniref:Uncharacterized protein n=2 Tax=Sodalis glossinidius (strain morsitans) TaxID=343509 RepID=Q2NW82_SODGM|nr:hypothetical protein SG0318 [Sodalis glossinidius str. 'morsitans']